MIVSSETGDFLARIRSVYNQFTRVEKKVADYIMEHPGEVIFMSITELSDACGVGETSVFRFCRTMGMGGYQEFKMRFSLSMQTDVGKEDVLTGAITPWDDLNALVQKVLQTEQRALSETAALLDVKELDRAVDYLSQALRIIFFGVGASFTAALKTSHKFLRIEPKVNCVNDAHTQAMLAATMSAEDVAVVFSYSGSTKDMCDTLSIASQRGVPVILVTHFPKSAGAEFATVVLQCGCNESPLQSGSVAAKVGQLFLIDCMFYGFCCHKPEARSAARSATAHAIANKLL